MLEIGLRKYETAAVLDLSGTVDIDSANLIEAVGWCLSNGYKDIVLNFEGINLVNYAGLSVLTIAYKDAENHQGRIKFINVSAHIEKTLSFVCLDRVFDIFPDEESALNSFKEERAISEIQKMRLRRRFKRLPLDIDIEFRPVTENAVYQHGKVLNLSAVGVLVFADKAYPLGTIVEIKFSLLPKPGHLQLDAKVVWLVEKEVQPQIYPGMGLEFYNLDNDKQRQILEFVERNLPLSCTQE